MRIRSITAALACLSMVALVLAASSGAAVRASARPLLSARVLARPASSSAPVRLASAGGSVGAPRNRGRLLVKFAAHTAPAVRERILRRLGARRVGAIAHLGIAVVDVPPAKKASVLAALKRSPAVAFAEPDGVSRIAYTPNDTYYNGSASPCSSSLGCWPYGNLDLPSAWDATTGSSSVTVAVVDTGVDGADPDLSGAVLAGYDFVNGTATSAGANSDDNGHGTEAAGIIAARIDNGAGVPGVCGNCKILPVKVLDSSGSGSNSNIASGITWAADHGATVINLSLASTTNDSSVQTAIDYAIGKGIVVVAAAGNASSTSPSTSPGGYPAWNATNSSDATAEGGLISVGAIDYNKNLYSFSNHGSWVDVAASGCAITTNNSGGYATSGFCGTSAAAPFVSGIAALMLSYDSALTPAQTKSDIDSSAAASSVDTVYGVADAYAALEAAGYTAPAAPTDSVAPTVSGTAQVGQTLSASNGSWTGSPTSYAYQWQSSANGTSSWNAISGATSSTYAIDAAYAGDYLRVEVTATNGTGSTSADSAATVQVTAAAPTNSSAPTISGTARAGQTLTATNGTWTGSPTGYSYQWQSSATGTSGWSAIAGATGASYAVDAVYVGDYLRVEVSATSSGGSTAADSAATSQVAAAASPPSNSSPPTVSGTVQVGQTLSASNGSWTGSPTSYAYQWQSSATGTSGWSGISGATGSSYAIDAAYAGDYLRVEVTATNADGSASADSAATVQVTAAAPTNSTAPTISGTAQAGQTLTAGDGRWTGSPTYTLQWQYSTDGTTWSDVPGATGSSYAIDTTYVGDYLRVEVTASNSGGSTTADSVATGQVAAASSGGSGGSSGGSGGSSGGSGGSSGSSGGSSGGGSGSSSGGGSSGGGSTGSGGGPTGSADTGGTGGTNAPAVAVPDLQVRLSADHTNATAGAQIVWRVTVSDATGSGDASDVDLDVALPSGLRLVQSTADLGSGCTSGSGSALVCTLGSIAAGSAGHVTIETTVTTAGDETLQASVNHTLTDANPADDTAALTLPAAAPAATAPATSGPSAGAPSASGGGKPTARTVVSGKPRVGSTLVATYKGRGRPVAYHWQVRRVVVVKGHKRIRWKTIHGQTKRRLRVRKAYAGKVVRVVVAYMRNGHRHTKASHPTKVKRRT